jgi:uncharacterized membrane protein YraQ (UPF0718 family)
LIAVPWFKWYGLTALIVFLGWRTGLVISLSAVTVGFIAGIVIDTLAGHSPDAWAAPVLARNGGCREAECCDTVATNAANLSLLDVSNPKEKVRLGARFAMDLLRELGPWMIGRILLGAAIEAFVPKEVVTS